MPRWLRLLDDRHGSVPIEYGLIAALVSIALLVSVGGFADAFRDVYEGLAATMLGP